MDDPATAPEDAKNDRLARAEAVVRALRARLAQVHGALCALPDGIVLADREGRITDMNLGAAHLTGWTEAKARGKPLHDVVVLCDSEGRHIDLVAAPHAGGQVTRLVRRDEHQVLVDAAIAPIEGEGKEPCGWVVSFRNVTAAKRIQDELTFHATHDALTGVLNRRAFEVQLQRAVAHAERHGTPYALLYLDLDRFKNVNDSAGHIAGDELLRVLSALLQRSLRDRDSLARLGGDEFAILLEHCEPKEAEEIAERVRAAVEAFRFRWLGRDFTVGTSIGLVSFRSGALSPQHVLRRADEMCYLAKSEGRNRVHVFDSGPPPVGRRRKRSGGGLRTRH